MSGPANFGYKGDVPAPVAPPPNYEHHDKEYTSNLADFDRTKALNDAKRAAYVDAQKLEDQMQYGMLPVGRKSLEKKIDAVNELPAKVTHNVAPGLVATDGNAVPTYQSPKHSDHGRQQYFETFTDQSVTRDANAIMDNYNKMDGDKLMGTNIPLPFTKVLDKVTGFADNLVNKLGGSHGEKKG
eukprot:EC124837.1.p1 GENE.EC124837.1~~EC124837.1.p1  ORF type:complete len:184 (+),score=31.69 EC124837.1:73-624(+)